MQLKKTELFAIQKHEVMQLKALIQKIYLNIINLISRSQYSELRQP